MPGLAWDSTCCWKLWDLEAARVEAGQVAAQVGAGRAVARAPEEPVETPPRAGAEAAMASAQSLVWDPGRVQVRAEPAVADSAPEAAATGMGRVQVAVGDLEEAVAASAQVREVLEFQDRVDPVARGEWVALALPVGARPA